MRLHIGRAFTTARKTGARISGSCSGDSESPPGGFAARLSCPADLPLFLRKALPRRDQLTQLLDHRHHRVIRVHEDGSAVAERGKDVQVRGRSRKAAVVADYVFPSGDAIAKAVGVFSHS